MLFCYLDTQGLVSPRERKYQAHTDIIFSQQGQNVQIRYVTQNL